MREIRSTSSSPQLSALQNILTQFEANNLRVQNKRDNTSRDDCYTVTVLLQGVAQSKSSRVAESHRTIPFQPLEPTLEAFEE